MKRKKFKPGELHFLLIPPFLWLFVFFIIPMIIVLIFSVSERGLYGGIEAGFTMQSYIDVFDPVILKIVFRSFVFALITTIVTLLIGYPVAYYIAFSSTRMKVFLLFMIILPYWTNFLVRMYSITILLGLSGLVNTLLLTMGIITTPLQLVNNRFSVLYGFIYCNLPFMIIPVYAALDRMNISLLEASMDLGATKLKTFLRITLPYSMTGIVAGIIFVFIPTIGNFVVPDILGGTDTYMIGNIIATQFQLGRNWPFGSAISSTMIFFIMILVSLYIYFFNPSDGKTG